MQVERFPDSPSADTDVTQLGLAVGGGLVVIHLTERWGRKLVSRRGASRGRLSALLANRRFIWCYSVAWALGLYLVYFHWSLPDWLQWGLSALFVLFLPPFRLLAGRRPSVNAE